jgi:hypothetical protein
MAVTLRGILLMTLMPSADYAEILATLFGDLAAVPWHQPFAVPAGPVFGTWREAAGPGAAAAAAGGRAGRDCPGAPRARLPGSADR